MGKAELKDCTVHEVFKAKKYKSLDELADLMGCAINDCPNRCCEPESKACSNCTKKEELIQQLYEELDENRRCEPERKEILIQNKPTWLCGDCSRQWDVSGREEESAIHWAWLSPEDNIIHAYHPRRNSVTACGLDWDGWTYSPLGTQSKHPLCEDCKKAFTPVPAVTGKEKP